MGNESDKPESGAGEPKAPKKKAEDNPWYLLATLYGVPRERDFELKAKNRAAWNRYFVPNLDEETRTKLIEKKRHPAEELTPFSPEELQEVAAAFVERCKAPAKKHALPASGEEIHFSNVEFDQKAFFDGYLFSRASFFRDAAFSGGASFRGATFSAEAYFDCAAFSGWANFDAAAFSGLATFAGATFSYRADFDRATFSDEAYFNRAAFSGLANFGGAAFSGLAFFRDAAISGEAYFDGATFPNRADFDGATFSNEAAFRGATFSGMASSVARPSPAWPSLTARNFRRQAALSTRR